MMNYEHGIHTCNVEFSDALGPTQEITSALYACFIVHEATHGAIDSKGIRYRPHNRIRIERLCTAEHNRFAARLTALDPERYPKEILHEDFRAGYWDREWTTSRPRRIFSFLSRLFADW
jgi:hypothetical protein